MNYYERHLGDYARATAHLSMLEHGAFNLLLDRYYTAECGIAHDQAYRLARARSREERAAVDNVLAEFFVQEDGLWVNQRVRDELVKAHRRITAARENGKRGGKPKQGGSAGQGAESSAEPDAEPDAGSGAASDVAVDAAADHIADPINANLPTGLADGLADGVASANPSSPPAPTPAPTPAQSSPDTRHQSPDSKHQSPNTSSVSDDTLTPRSRVAGSSPTTPSLTSPRSSSSAISTSPRSSSPKSAPRPAQPWTPNALSNALPAALTTTLPAAMHVSSPRRAGAAHAAGVINAANAVCQALRSRGVVDVNPQHGQLQELLAQGAQVQEFVDAVPIAQRKNKGFGYVLGIVRGQREDARVKAQLRAIGDGGVTNPNTNPNTTAHHSYAVEEPA